MPRASARARARPAECVGAGRGGCWRADRVGVQTGTPPRCTNRELITPLISCKLGKQAAGRSRAPKRTCCPATSVPSSSEMVWPVGRALAHCKIGRVAGKAAQQFEAGFSAPGVRCNRQQQRNACSAQRQQHAVRLARQGTASSSKQAKRRQVAHLHAQKNFQRQLPPPCCLARLRAEEHRMQWVGTGQHRYGTAGMPSTCASASLLGLVLLYVTCSRPW